MAETVDLSIYRNDVNASDQFGNTPRMLAAEKGMVEMVEALVAGLQ